MNEYQTVSIFPEMEKIFNEQLRQYKHNNGEGFVCAYHEDIKIKIEVAVKRFIETLG